MGSPEKRVIGEGKQREVGEWEGGEEGKVPTHLTLSHPYQSYTADKENTRNHHYNLIPNSSPSNLCKQLVPHGTQENKETLLEQTAWVGIEDHKYLKAEIKNSQSFRYFLCLVFPEILSYQHYFLFPSIFIMLI